MKRELALDTQAIYQIEVQGYLEEHWSDWFDGMTIEPNVSEEGLKVTTFTGRIIDQAALHGILRKLYDMGLPLLSVNLIERKEE